MKYLTNLFSDFQKVGKALMLPVSVLPVAGILLGVGASNLSFIPESLSTVMELSGGAIFGHLPLIFAIGVALGFSKNDGVCALAAVVGYFVMESALGGFGKMLGVSTVVIGGVDSIQTGVVGGILIGADSASMYNRFYQIELPSYLGFFSGKRFVPIITSFAAIILALVLALVWPPLGAGIENFSHWAASESPEVAFSLYGLIERSLIPFGLHHIWNVPFFFETGSFTDPQTGKVVTGEIARYLSGDPSAGNLAGGYLFKMFGLPGAAIAIWHSARPEERKRVGGIMISAALTSFLTGITEPIEFAFLFLAPLLYAIHAFMAAFAYYLCIVLDIKHGTTFSHGLIDYILLFPQSKNALWLIVLGAGNALLYYVTFRFVIKYFNLLTPGREEEVIGSDEGSAQSFKNGDSEFLISLLNGIGGAKNITNLDACITRLRVQLKDTSLTNPELLKSIGARGVMTIGNGVQIIFGTRSENIKTQLEKYLEQGHGHKEVQEGFDSKRFLESVGGCQNIEEVSFCGLTRLRVQLKSELSIYSLALEKMYGTRFVVSGSNVAHLVIGAQAENISTELNNLLNKERR